MQESELLAHLTSGKRLPKPEILCTTEMYNYLMFLSLKMRSKSNAICRYELMQSCWRADANERPQFAAIRQQFDRILEHIGDNYGYLPLIVENTDDKSDIEHSKL
jgi:hypothetical protein